MTVYWQIFSFQFKRYLSYPSELLATIIHRLLDTGYILVLWAIIAASADGSIDFVELLFYFFIGGGINEFTSPNKLRYAKYINQIIKSGDINHYLIRPVAVIPYLYLTSLGENGAILAFSGFTVVLGALLASALTLEQIILFVITFTIGMMVSIALNLLIGATALITTEASNIRNVVRVTMRVLAGLMIPINFFPEHIERVLLLTPFPSMIYIPTSALTNNYHIITSELIIINLAWAVSLLVLTYFIWKILLRRYEAIGI